MTKAMKDLLKVARNAAKSNDPEAAHGVLDEALHAYVAAIDPEGAEELGRIVADMTLWYA